MNETITVDVVNPKGKKAGTADLPGEFFDAQTNIPLIHQVVTAQLAAARQGTHATKTRSEVRGGGAKPWRQKGTGRARHGSLRSPIWAGGAVSHGPQPRNYAQRTNKKMVAAALRGALSDRARDGQVFVVSEIVEGDVPSTKGALATLAALGVASKALVVLDRFEDVAWMSLRNVANVHVLAVDQLNAYDVLVADSVVFTSAALAAFTTRGAATAEAEQVEDKPAKAEKKAEPKKSEAKQEDAEGVYRGEKPPAGYDIKGNEDSGKYHTPDSPWYDRTVAEVWFNSVEAAEAAGFVAAATPKEDEDK